MIDKVGRPGQPHLRASYPKQTTNKLVVFISRILEADLLCQNPKQALCASVSIDRVRESKANGQIYEWNSPVYQFYE